MFRSNCRVIFRLIFQNVQCTSDNAFNLRDLVLQELFKIKYIGANDFRTLPTDGISLGFVRLSAAEAGDLMGLLRL